MPLHRFLQSLRHVANLVLETQLHLSRTCHSWSVVTAYTEMRRVQQEQSSAAN